jgi:hypothetical protein
VGGPSLLQMSVSPRMSCATRTRSSWYTVSNLNGSTVVSVASDAYALVLVHGVKPEWQKCSQQCARPGKLCRTGTAAVFPNTAQALTLLLCGCRSQQRFHLGSLLCTKADCRTVATCLRVPFSSTACSSNSLRLHTALRLHTGTLLAHGYPCSVSEQAQRSLVTAVPLASVSMCAPALTKRRQLEVAAIHAEDCILEPARKARPTMVHEFAAAARCLGARAETFMLIRDGQPLPACEQVMPARARQPPGRIDQETCATAAAQPVAKPT